MKRSWEAARQKVLSEGRKGVCKRDVVCPECGAERNVYADTDKVLCRDCSMRKRRTGKIVACPRCGKERYRNTSELGRGNRYCSYECANADKPQTFYKDPEAWRDKIAESKVGKKNPNFKHGQRSGDPVRRKFSLALKGETLCRNCGAPDGLHLHHAIPRSMFRAGRDEIRNGVPLCAKCHIGWHRRCVTLYRDIFTAEEWEYLTGVNLLGQNVKAWLDDRYPSRPVELVGLGEAFRRVTA